MAEEVLDIELTVIKADGLAAKDINWFGMKTGSDPYVEVRLLAQGPNTREEDKVFVGKTPPVMKTLSPTFDLTFTVELAAHHFTEDAIFELTIMDYDRHNEDDLMGVVPVYVRPDKPGETTKWYGVPASSGKGEEATGRVQCHMVVKKKRG